MTLTGRIQVLEAYRGNTTIDLFKHLIVGDVIVGETKIKETTGGRGIYATYIELTNPRTNYSWTGSMQEVSVRLSNIKYIQIL